MYDNVLLKQRMYTEEFSVLVTGANRGLGLALVRRFLTSSVRPTCVFAACRHPEKAEVNMFTFIMLLFIINFVFIVFLGICHGS